MKFENLDLHDSFIETPFWIEGTISDSLGLSKIFKPFGNKEKYLSIITCTIFSQNIT